LRGRWGADAWCTFSRLDPRRPAISQTFLTPVAARRSTGWPISASSTRRRGLPVLARLGRAARSHTRTSWTMSHHPAPPEAGFGRSPFLGPTFLVVSPAEDHLVTRHGDTWLPDDEWHVKEIGSAQTECGLETVTWHLFWTLRFEDAMDRACPACQGSFRVASGTSSGSLRADSRRG
jgi:hypothetical protein